MSVPFKVIPYNNLEYDAQFMEMVDQLDPKSDTGPNIYLCFFSLEKGKYGGGYSPRESVFIKFLNRDKEQFKYSTDERDIKIDGTTIYYFLMLRGTIISDSPASKTKTIDDGNSARTKYGKIYDAILMSCSKNNCFIIYAQDIDSADKLFKDAVKNRTITLENITKVVEKKKTRFEVDKVINDQKKAEATQKAKTDAEENIKKGKERSKIIQDVIYSIPDTVDLRWQVFRLHDIGDTIVSENKVLPKFSKPVSVWDPEKRPINIDSPDYKKDIPSNDNVDAIPDDFSWVKKVNESKSIHVIRVKPIRINRMALLPKYTILVQENSDDIIIAQSYELTIDKLELTRDNLDGELEFKKRMIIPFIEHSANSGEKYFVLNAEDEIAGDAEMASDAREIKVLRYFLRKYGIGYVESPVDKKYIFKFTHDDYINIEIKNHKKYNMHIKLTFGNTPIEFGLFDAIPFVLRCLKNDKLLMKQIDNGPSTPTPEVLVLSQLTKDKISSATSVYFVVEKNTKHRKNSNSSWGYIGDIDGFTGPVVMHNKEWSLGCVQSILDESKCTTYNELTLLTTGETANDSSNIDKYKQYLLNGKFPNDFSLVIRGSDDYCKFVALEPYGNVFDKNRVCRQERDRCFDRVILSPGLGLENEQHPVFYIFNAANKASAVNAFNAKLEEEMKKVISVKDGKNVVNDKLDSNQFLKTFKSYNKAPGDSYYTDSITPFVKSITDETPKIGVLIPENIELESVEPLRFSYSRREGYMDRDARGEVQSSPPPSSSVQRAQYSTEYRQGVAKSAFSDKGFKTRHKITIEGGKSNKKRTKKSRRNKGRSNKRNARSNKRATRSNKRKYNNTRKK